MKKIVMTMVWLALMSTGWSETLCGVEYFGAWANGQGGGYSDGNRWCYPWTNNEWLPDFPERTPLYGKFLTQSVMNDHICAASGNGVDYFKFLWYNIYDGAGTPAESDLNHGVIYFKDSPENWRMKFMIEFCNAPDGRGGTFGAANDQQWLNCCIRWKPFFEKSSYLRVNNKLVFQIHSWDEFYKECNYDLNKAKWRLSHLRACVKTYWGWGLDMLIGVGVGTNQAINSSHPVVQTGFDWTTSYANIGDSVYGWGGWVYPYNYMTDIVYNHRLAHFNDAIPYLPIVMVGWDGRPWGYPSQNRPSYQQPTYNEFKYQLELAKWDTEQHSVYGFPGQPSISIYNWSEYGEGGFLSPTTGWGFQNLDAIRYTFGAPDIFAGRYSPKNYKSALCLVPEAQSTANGAKICQWYPAYEIGGEAWWWNFVKLSNGYYKIINFKSGKALVPDGQSTADGVRIVQWDYVHNNAWWWEMVFVNNAWSLKNVKSGKYLCIDGQSTAPGAYLIQWNYINSDSWKWSIDRPWWF